VFAEAERLTGDSLIGLHAGEHAEPRGPLAYLLLATPKLEDGARQMERVSRLVVDTMRMTLEPGSDTAAIVIDLGTQLGESPHAVDYSLLTMAYMFHSAVGRDFHLIEAHVRHPPRGDRAEAVRAFGCPVHFGRRDNRVVFSSRYLQATSRGANPLISEQIEKFTAAVLAHVTPKTFRDRVADAARALLADGRRADRAVVARLLRVSERTLQRRLEEEGTSFTAVRDTVLWEVVDALMSNRELKIASVALSVGFREVAACSKAFKRRTGLSPSHFRERAAGQTALRPSGA
jgi:AraC-like DNA-binding protein